jgi:putative transposase
MPRANRHFLPGYVWHITHRCHEKKFLLKFARDRQRYLRWVFEAKKRYGLSVLNYMITSNHVHLLIKDTGPDVIARSIQLIAGRTAQEYNQRKNRQGAFWEDRYHATAIDTDKHLHRCIVYIDLNMIRAGVVDHPVNWTQSGFYEIQRWPKRYRVIDLPALLALCGFTKLADFQQAHRQWMDEAIHGELALRDERWTEALAVGSQAFVEKVKSELGPTATHRELGGVDGTYALRESAEAYRAHFDAENEVLRLKNALLWKTVA